MKTFLIWAAFILSGMALNSQALEVRMRPPQSAEDLSHDYFTGLAQLALDETDSESGKAVVTVVGEANFSQARAMEELAVGDDIDLDWAGTDQAREDKLLAIRIPLTGGLLGYRVPVIRKESIPVFEKIRTLEDLKKLTAVQGSAWPDSDILEAAGLPVFRVPLFGSMYPMLKAGRVDYFPRGLNEVYSEVKADTSGTLVAYDKLLIVYRFPMYFFTSRQNSRLADRIDRGLGKALADGSFLRYMKSNPSTAAAFPLSKYKNSLLIRIENPFLPKDTPVDDPKLWLDIGR